MRPAILACCLALTIPLPDRSAAQACFDAARCARDALMSTRALSREISLMSNSLRALRDEANLRDTELAQMRAARGPCAARPWCRVCLTGDRNRWRSAQGSRIWRVA